MAFLNRVGALLKHNVSKHITSASAASSPSIFQVIRSMSMTFNTKIFVGGLHYKTNDETLRDHFSRYGDVEQVKIIVDRETGHSRGFGFVTFSSPEAASSAIQGVDGQELDGRKLRVNYATDKPRGGGYGGNWQGGNYPSGGYQGGNYTGDGNYGGGVGWGTGGGGGGSNEFSSGGGGNYPSGGNEFSSSGGNDASGGGAGYGSSSGSVRGGESGGSYSDSFPECASLLNGSPKGAHSGNQEEEVGGDRGKFEAGNDNFGQDIDENSRDEEDIANTRS